MRGELETTKSGRQALEKRTEYVGARQLAETLRGEISFEKVRAQPRMYHQLFILRHCSLFSAARHSNTRDTSSVHIYCKCIALLILYYWAARGLNLKGCISFPPGYCLRFYRAMGSALMQLTDFHPNLAYSRRRAFAQRKTTTKTKCAPDGCSPGFEPPNSPVHGYDGVPA